MWAKLSVIIWKNFVIRKRHWVLSFAEILIPILLFSFVAYGRSKIGGMNKLHLKEPTYYDINNIEDVYSHLDVGEDFSLWYSPYSDITAEIVRRVQDKLQIRGDAVKEFPSKTDLLKQFGQNSTSLIAAVNFNINDPQHLDYDLSIYDKYFTWNTDRLYVPLFIPEDARSSEYLYKGFTALQVAIDMAFLELSSSKRNIDIGFSIQQFPYPPRTIDSGLNQLFLYFFPIITIFSFIFLCPAVLQRVGEEKHSGTKEYMKMVGVKSWMIWLGWFIHALMTNFVSIVAIVVLMKVSFWRVPYPPIEYSEGTVLFAFLLLYCTAAITFCFLIASIFNTPSIGTVIGILVWIFSYFVPQTFVSSNEDLLWKWKIPLAIFPNMALHYGYSAISVYEMREVGVQWHNIFQSGSGGENDVTMGNVFMMFIFDTIMFMLLTLYIENIKPGEYGIPKSYGFPLTYLKKLIKCFTIGRIETSPEQELLERNVGKRKMTCIEIHNLGKVFDNNVAIDNLNLNIYKNQITVLLGQNGAGKTTTMSILTGMINGSSGSITINGMDIRKHTDDIRKDMGLCPQHNLLFPDLTVIEHLIFFAKLKNSTSAGKESLKMLKTLDMDDKRNSMTSELSGGMKRKLCLGIAWIGNPEIIILDEPTSGMDPESRRKVWDLLLEYRKSKTILLTTHLMDEAEVLGDWIAIMAAGHLQCYDTPIHLKMKYNTGYHLSLMLQSKELVDEITTVLQHYIPRAELIRQSEDTVVYLLPLDKKLYKREYRELFNKLEDNKLKYKIITIGLNLSTLDDVFLKAKDECDGGTEDVVDGVCIQDLEQCKLQGTTRHWINIYSLLMKRIYFFKRKYYWFIPAIFVTICILLLTVWLGMSNDNYYNGGGPRLNLSLEAYGKTRVYYGGNPWHPTVSKLQKFYHEVVVHEHGTPVFQEDVSKGVIQMGIDNLAFYKRLMIAAAEFNRSLDSDEVLVNCLYSADSLHGLPISVNLAMNALVKALLNSSFAITISNVPLKPIYSGNAPSELSTVNVMSVWLILIPISMLFLMSNFIIFPNTEVSTNFIQIQTMAGIKTYLYWSINLLFDIAFSIPVLTLLIILIYLLNWLAYDSTAFQMTELLTIMTIFLSYTAASLPFTYLLSYRKTITGGFTLLLMLGIFTGIIPTVIIIAMELSRQNYYMQIASYLKHVFIIIFPQFSISYLSARFSRKYVENFNWKYMDPNKRKYMCDIQSNPCCSGENTIKCTQYQNYFLNEEFGLLYILLEMLIPFALFFIILSFWQTEEFEKVLDFIKFLPSHISNINTKKRNKPMDIDREIPENKALVVTNLTKSFGPKQIVKNLNLKLKKNKCFGLLGVNGAGKSTTFRMLTKNLFFDEGEITISDGDEKLSIKEQEYCKKIGYCPQEDCLNYFLTGNELVLSMARMKGYSRQEAVIVTDRLLKDFGLTQFADKPCSQYSGGNKRKLSTCIAFLGFPKVILLDEPTSGVDPASRRKFWNILSAFKKKNDTSILLCSHSMEECENLCDEIAIMKAGTIKDQGSLLSLKCKYQTGFKIQIKLKVGTDWKDQDSLKETIAKELNAEVLEQYDETIEYKVKNKDKKLGDLFCKLEELKDSSNIIDDYIVSQISLEDIFLRVAENKT